MYLLNITNFDYVMMTILFGCVFVCAYKFRRNNQSSNDFLLGGRNGLLVSGASLAGLGLIEFIIGSSYGAYAGLTALFLGFPIYIVVDLLISKRVGHSLLFRSIINREYSSRSITVLVVYVMIMLLASGIAIVVMVSLLKSLLGWEFANSTLSLIAIIAVSLLLGGSAGLSYNKTIASTLILLVLVAANAISYHNIGFGQLSQNLSQVALDNKLLMDHFTGLTGIDKIWLQFWLIILTSLAFFVINPFSFFFQSHTGKSGTIFVGKLIKLFLIGLIILSGIFALATPNKLPIIAGKKIVTVQTRLDNGELGYIVRAVPGNQATLQRGIIPVKATDSDSETLDNQSGGNFDFASAGLVIIKKALPYAFVSLFIVILFFFKTISDNMLFATLAIIHGFYAPKFNKSGEELENLWAARVFLFTLFVIAICVGLVLFKFFSLYYMLALLLIFSLPIALTIIVIPGTWWSDLIVYLVLLILVLTANVAGIPSLLPIVKFIDLADMIAKVSIVAVLLFLMLNVPVNYLKAKNGQ